MNNQNLSKLMNEFKNGLDTFDVSELTNMGNMANMGCMKQMSVSFDFQKNMVLSLTLTTATLIVGLVLMQVGYGQTNNNNSEKNEDAARTYLSCYDGTMSTFLLQTLFGPPEIKFNLTDLMSPEVKQYISDSCKFYHEKSGIWLTGTDNVLDREIVSKYRAEFMQKVKEPDSLLQRDQAYIQLNKTN